MRVRNIDRIGKEIEGTVNSSCRKGQGRCLGAIWVDGMMVTFSKESLGCSFNLSWVPTPDGDGLLFMF